MYNTKADSVTSAAYGFHVGSSYSSNSKFLPKIRFGLLTCLLSTCSAISSDMARALKILWHALNNSWYSSSKWCNLLGKRWQCYLRYMQIWIFWNKWQEANSSLIDLVPSLGFSVLRGASSYPSTVSSKLYFWPLNGVKSSSLINSGHISPQYRLLIL